MSPNPIQSFFALAIGFAFAGLLATGYQAATSRPASFRLLQRGPQPAAFAAVPFLVFAAPFIIMRNTLRGRQRRRLALLGGDVGDHDRRLLEPDVGHRRDRAAHRRSACCGT